MIGNALALSALVLALWRPRNPSPQAMSGRPLTGVTHVIARPDMTSVHVSAQPGIATRDDVRPYAELMLDLGKLDVDEIAIALSDQTDYEYRWLIDPRNGEIAFWTSDTGIDGENPIDLDELDLMPIDPLPSWVWYADMADFAEGVSDEAAGRRLERAIRGRGAFRRFKDELFEEYPDLVSAWHAFHDARANRRAVEWLLGQGLIRDDAARKFLVDHPDPDLP